MILHDRCTLKLTETIDQLDDVQPRSVDLGAVQCEINPLDTQPASDSGPIVTRYLWVTTYDLITAIDAQRAAWKASYSGSKGVRLTITYNGKSLSPEAGFEVHKVLGRFHHIECVIKDFGFTGS